MNRLNEELLFKASMDMAPNEYKTISIRQPAKSATMMNLMSVVLDKPISSMLTEEISEALANYLLEDESNIPIIEEYMKKFIVLEAFERILMKEEPVAPEGGTIYFKSSDVFTGGCLKILKQKGIIDYAKRDLKKYFSEDEVGE